MFNGYVKYNSIVGNNITGNDNGIVLFGFSNQNSIVKNNIANSDGNGIWLDGTSNNNRFYHNNFNNNLFQVQSGNSTNVWDDGYPSGGNYWSDYNGTDSNDDGIGGTSYIIDANNIDHYPLMVPQRHPEFRSFLILPLFMRSNTISSTVYRRRHSI